MPDGQQATGDTYVKLPDGSYGRFPAGIPDEEIAASISKTFDTVPVGGQRVNLRTGEGAGAAATQQAAAVPKEAGRQMHGAISLMGRPESSQAVDEEFNKQFGHGEFAIPRMNTFFAGHPDIVPPGGENTAWLASTGVPMIGSMEGIAALPEALGQGAARLLRVGPGNVNMGELRGISKLIPWGKGQDALDFLTPERADVPIRGSEYETRAQDLMRRGVEHAEAVKNDPNELRAQELMRRGREQDIFDRRAAMQQRIAAKNAPPTQDELYEQRAQDLLRRQQEQDALDRAATKNAPPKPPTQDELMEQKAQDLLQRQKEQDILDRRAAMQARTDAKNAPRLTPFGGPNVTATNSPALRTVGPLEKGNITPFGASPTTSTAPPGVLPKLSIMPPPAAAEEEGIIGSIGKPSGRLILTPEEIAANDRMQAIAKRRASEHGMQYAAGMRPAGGGRVPRNPTPTETFEYGGPREKVPLEETPNKKLRPAADD